MTEVSSKLRIRPGDRVLVLGDQANVRELIGTLPTGARLVEPPEPGEVVILFVTDESALRAGTDLERDRLAALTDQIADLAGVSRVAVDATWSAMRLRPSEPYRS